MKNLDPATLAAWLADTGRGKPVLLDVREPWEYDTCRIEGSRLVPLRELPARAAEYDPQAQTVMICHHGGRSLQAAMFLERQGFACVFNLTGGIAAWSRSVDLSMPQY
ncbi:MAG: sulfurtransferase [Betaproteobacteria bacterium]|nr:sulfurtransferase [Betaproteobacteria bacterium]